MSSSYSNPRSTTALGVSRSGERLFRGITPSDSLVDYGVEPSIQVYFYNRQGRRLGQASTEQGVVRLIKATFTLTENGCGSAELDLTTDLGFTLDLGYYIDIHLFHSETPWYSGLISRVPRTGNLSDRENTLHVRCFGFYSMLEKCILKGDGLRPTSFALTDVTSIVVSLATGFIGPKIGAVINPSKIEPVDYLATSLNFEMATARKALEDLSEIAQNYVFGVDASRSFFFRRRERGTSRESAFPTHHVSEVNVERNLESLVNRVYVRSGDLDSGSNPVIMREAKDSQRQYGLHEKLLSAPTILNSADILRWADYQLQQGQDPLEKVTVKLTDVSTTMLVPGDRMQVHAGVLGAGSFSENFDDSIIDSEWTSVNTTGYQATSNATPGYLRVHPSTVVLTVPVSTGALSIGHTYRRVAGNFQVDMTLQGFSGGTTQGTDYPVTDQVGLMLRESDPSRFLALIRTRRGFLPGVDPAWSILRVDAFDGQRVINQLSNSIAWDPLVMRILRLNAGFTTWIGPSVNSLVLLATPSSWGVNRSPFKTSNPLAVGVTAGVYEYTRVDSLYYYVDSVDVSQYDLSYDLPIREAKYTVANGRIDAEVTLGDVIRDLPASILKIMRDVKNEELRQDRNVSALSGD